MALSAQSDALRHFYNLCFINAVFRLRAIRPLALNPLEPLEFGFHLFNSQVKHPHRFVKRVTNLCENVLKCRLPAMQRVLKEIAPACDLPLEHLASALP